MPTLSVSTWSLHRTIGDPAVYGPESNNKWGNDAVKPTQLTLLEVPARLAALGIHKLEVCHFHLPSTNMGYINAFKSALTAAGVELWSVLIDAGDITDPVHGARDLDWISRWIAVAGALGAKNARVIAGKAKASPEALALSAQRLKELAAVAKANNVRLTTENWFDLLAQPAAVLQLLDALGGDLGLNFDFGNWHEPNKYDNLTQIAARAQSSHAKAHFTGAYKIDSADYTRCLDICKQANFSGPHTLIYDDPNGPDEWQGLQIEKSLVDAYL